MDVEELYCSSIDGKRYLLLSFLKVASVIG